MPTREGLKKHWKEVEAFKNGETIQFRLDTCYAWKDIEDPSFTANCKYRVKPEETYALGDIVEVFNNVCSWGYFKIVRTDTSRYCLISCRDGDRWSAGGHFTGGSLQIPKSILCDCSTVSLKKIPYCDFLRAESKRLHY
ncbi:hypothetical protein [Zooshikella sp. RANM57]|uniref:hypothetical protein n=1 Tax=Zooshikella sp. RANM57 TaxID=3425863 RepID=UPI003D6E3C37